MNIREAIIADAGGIAAVHVNSWRTTYKGIVPEEYLINLQVESRKQSWETALTHLNFDEKIFVCENPKGKIIGFVNGGTNRNAGLEFDCEIYAIYLLQEYQRQGIGKKLCNEMIGWFKQRNFRSMMLWVLEDNQAKHFYQKIGGTAIEKKTITIGNKELIELAMGWDDITSIQ
ncbi:GNAT family N-acetyltransferase [Bacillaceae bacterium Marseille-Q3522]|nr:GNAT family N-acetyltransferase [Bacillaceae bacterium Marseille-Q3522]